MLFVTGGRATYGIYVTEELAVVAQSRWNLTHLLPADDPEQAVELPASVAVGGVRCDEWFVRWQGPRRPAIASADQQETWWR